MTDLGAVLLGLCGGTISVCSGMLKVMYFAVEVVSNAEGVEASFGTLNSIMPNVSDAAYDSNILWHVVSSKDIKSNL